MNQSIVGENGKPADHIDINLRQINSRPGGGGGGLLGKPNKVDTNKSYGESLNLLPSLKDASQTQDSKNLSSQMLLPSKPNMIIQGGGSAANLNSSNGGSLKASSNFGLRNQPTGLSPSVSRSGIPSIRDQENVYKIGADSTIHENDQESHYSGRTLKEKGKSILKPPLINQAQKPSENDSLDRLLNSQLGIKSAVQENQNQNQVVGRGGRSTHLSSVAANMFGSPSKTRRQEPFQANGP